MIVGPTPAQMDDFCDLHGTPDAPVSRIVTVKATYVAKSRRVFHKILLDFSSDVPCQIEYKLFA